MNIRYFEKGGKVWLDIRGPGFRERKSSGTSDRAEAERRAPAIVAAVLQGIGAPKAPTSGNDGAPGSSPKGPTLKEAFTSAMKTRDRWRQSKDQDTLHYVFGCLRIPEDTPMVTITRDFVRKLKEQWLDEPGKRKGSKLSPSAVNSRLSMLSVLLETCDLPPHTVKHMSVEGRRRTRRMAQREVEAVQSWLCANSKLKGALTLCDLITVALETAAREGELLGLTHADVNLEDAYVVFRNTKNHRTRHVVLDAASLRIFKARQGVEGGPFGDLEASQLKSLWSQARAALGLKEDHEFVFHALRHESITRMIEAGAPQAVVKDIAGHTQIATTMLYTHTDLEAQRAARQAVAMKSSMGNIPQGGMLQ